MHVPSTTFLRLLICLNENEKRQWCLIYSVCKNSEEDCSSRGELTDVIKLSMQLFAELPDLRRSIRGSSHYDSNSNGLPKSELQRMQVWNLRTWYWETRTDLTLSHNTICLIFSVLRPRWKHRKQQVWRTFFPGNFGGKATYVSQT